LTILLIKYEGACPPCNGRLIVAEEDFIAIRSTLHFQPISF
jgi:hypothetical protein